MRAILVVLAISALAIDFAVAQTYKCQSGGKVYTANYPCPGYEYREPRPPAYVPPPRVEYEPRSSAPQPSAESPVVRQSNAMIAAALVDGDFAKAERLAVTREQWEMIGAAKRGARAEYDARAARAEASKRADEQAKATARAEARARQPKICVSNSQTYGTVNHSRYTSSLDATTRGITICP